MPVRKNEESRIFLLFTMQVCIDEMFAQCLGRSYSVSNLWNEFKGDSSVWYSLHWIICQRTDHLPLFCVTSAIWTRVYSWIIYLMETWFSFESYTCSYKG